MAEQTGKVYLVGAGPGEIAHLTIRGQQLLTQAEVVIYDALIDPQLLELTPTNCLHVNVGKRGNCPSTNQDDINRLLVEQCQTGKQTVRLKNGDPFIFGRCAAEIAALRATGCSFEVVPGLSSALAVPLLAGIPLTDLTLSRCFTVLSAHDPTILDWQALAQMDTLVILMGGKHLAEIIHQLQMQGKLPQTPVAVIRWGGRSNQRVWRGILADILEQTAGESLAPAVIIVGEVARLQLCDSAHPQDESLQLLPLREPGFYGADSKHPVPTVTESEAPQSGPLMGKTVLVTRSAGQSSQFNDLLKQQGAHVIGMPTLEIGPPSSWDALDQAIAHLAKFDWLILTSTNGVDYFFERLWRQGKDVRALAGIQIAVIGQKTAVSLNQRGFKPDFVPPEFVADSLGTHFPGGSDLTGTQILFPRVETGGRDTLVTELTTKGAEVVEVPAYQSRCPTTMNPLALDALRGGSVNVITFASSKTVKNFCQLLDQAAQELATDPRQGPADLQWQMWLEGVHLASIGPQTSNACRKLLGRVDLEAIEHTLEGLTQAIVDCFSET
jgi:uroporphyrinogen III methyltransferase/synthase